MRYKVLACFSLISVSIITCDGLGISPKLDFGPSQSSPKLIGSLTQYKTVPVKYKEETKAGGDFEGIGVVCVTGGCNTSKSDESKDTIKADVVVHVQTHIDLNKNNKSSFVDDTPDVPIIVGTAGTSFDNNQRQTFNQRPHLTNIDDTFSSAVPSISSSITPSFSPYSFNTPSLQSDSVYLQEPILPAEPRVDINIKTLPPVTLTMTDEGRYIKDIRYKTNGIRVPYFEPSYHNHYFGENPPPQFVWLTKTSRPLNQVKDTWKPSFVALGTTHRHTIGSGNTCSCKNQPTASGLQWHPNRRAYGADPGTQINDKLAPLN